MSLPDSILLTSFVLYRPFGHATPLTGTLTGRLVPSPTFESAGPSWTHLLDVNESIDIRDGCTRTAGTNALTYADGDEVRVTSGGSSGRYVVVWVEMHNEGTRNAFKRAYLMRHSV